MPQDFEDSAQAHAHHVVRSRRARRRWQQFAGILMLLAGYVCLAVTADTPSEWLLLRVVCGFGLLFAGFAVAIGPTVSSIFGDHD